jgi:prepilin-type N-terminal cleavage/methylation domain-containing protein
MSKDNSFFKTFSSLRQPKSKTGAGFTAIEMLLVVAILGILATLGQGSYTVWLKKVQVNTTIEQIRSSLIRAQEQAVAAEDGKAWGIHFETDRYIIFPTTIYNPAEPKNKVKLLSGISIVQPDSSLSDGTSGYSPNVVFEKFTGRTVNTGIITVAVSSDPTVTRQLVITFFGAIE